MPTLELSVTMKLDGVLLSGMPITTRLTVPSALDATQPYAVMGYSQIGAMPTVNALVVRPYDQPVTVRLNGQLNAGIPVNAGGLLLLFNVALDAGATTNVKILNASSDTTQLLFIQGGDQT